MNSFCTVWFVIYIVLPNEKIVPVPFLFVSRLLCDKVTYPFDLILFPVVFIIKMLRIINTEQFCI